MDKEQGSKGSFLIMGFMVLSLGIFFVIAFQSYKENNPDYTAGGCFSLHSKEFLKVKLTRVGRISYLAKTLKSEKSVIGEDIFTSDQLKENLATKIDCDELN